MEDHINDQDTNEGSPGLSTTSDEEGTTKTAGGTANAANLSAAAPGGKRKRDRTEVELLTEGGNNQLKYADASQASKRKRVNEPSLATQDRPSGKFATFLKGLLPLFRTQRLCHETLCSIQTSLMNNDDITQEYKTSLPDEIKKTLSATCTPCKGVAPCVEPGEKAKRVGVQFDSKSGSANNGNKHVVKKDRGYSRCLFRHYTSTLLSLMTKEEFKNIFVENAATALNKLYQELTFIASKHTMSRDAFSLTKLTAILQDIPEMSANNIDVLVCCQGCHGCLKPGCFVWKHSYCGTTSTNEVDSMVQGLSTVVKTKEEFDLLNTLYRRKMKECIKKPNTHIHGNTNKVPKKTLKFVCGNLKTYNFSLVPEVDFTPPSLPEEQVQVIDKVIAEIFVEQKYIHVFSSSGAPKLKVHSS